VQSPNAGTPVVENVSQASFEAELRARLSSTSSAGSNSNQQRTRYDRHTISNVSGLDLTGVHPAMRASTDGAAPAAQRGGGAASPPPGATIPAQIAEHVARVREAKESRSRQTSMGFASLQPVSGSGSGAHETRHTRTGTIDASTQQPNTATLPLTSSSPGPAPFNRLGSDPTHTSSSGDQVSQAGSQRRNKARAPPALPAGWVPPAIRAQSGMIITVTLMLMLPLRALNDGIVAVC